MSAFPTQPPRVHAHPFALVHTDRLDARPAADAYRRPWRASVRIAAGELTARVHELPPPGTPLRVLDDADGHGQAALAWLRANGRGGLPVALEAAGLAAGACGDALHRRLWRPHRFLEQELARVAPDARGAIDWACGAGREATYLASGGWRVTAVDRLPDALQRAHGLWQAAAGSLPHAGEPAWQVRDLEADAAPPNAFGLVTCFRYLHRPLLEGIDEWVAPGGRYIGATFTTVHRAYRGKPAADAHVLAPGELARFFRHGWRILRCSEEWLGDTHQAMIHAVRG